MKRITGIALTALAILASSYVGSASAKDMPKAVFDAAASEAVQVINDAGIDLNSKSGAIAGAEIVNSSAKFYSQMFDLCKKFKGKGASYSVTMKGISNAGFDRIPAGGEARVTSVCKAAYDGE